MAAGSPGAMDYPRNRRCARRLNRQPDRKGWRSCWPNALRCVPPKPHAQQHAQPAWHQRDGRWYMEPSRWTPSGRGRDHDHDGIADRHDRDGDGVRNSQDRAPDNPRRY